MHLSQWLLQVQRCSVVRLRRLLGFFIFEPLQKQAFDGLSIKNPGALRQGFFFVDKRFEISNLDLVKDIADMRETLEEFS